LKGVGFESFDKNLKARWIEKNVYRNIRHRQMEARVEG